MTNRLKEILVSLIFLVFGVLMYLQSAKIEPLMENELGSGFFPKVVALDMIVLAILNIIVNYARKEETVEEEKTKNDIKGGLITILLVGIYALTYQQIGFLIGSAVYLFLQILVLAPKAKRNIPLFAVISIIVPVFIYLLFTRLINMPLPKGIFGF